MESKFHLIKLELFVVVARWMLLLFARPLLRPYWIVVVMMIVVPVAVVDVETLFADIDKFVGRTC